ncbi:hypothetical protein [Metapseudomonas otitidis]|uniref:hypothetical protein n=1 Tax=Metapseudomonas otitidis TaxID=319939 RepID=UPI001F2AB089|nr:hypothetical protein [Pseudomonas otitidis]
MYKSCLRRKIVNSSIAIDDPVAKELLKRLYYRYGYDVPGLLNGNPDGVAVPSASPFKEHGDLFNLDKQLVLAKYLREGGLTPQEQGSLDVWMSSTQWLERAYGRALNPQERATILGNIAQEGLIGINGGRMPAGSTGAAAGNGRGVGASVGKEVKPEKAAGDTKPKWDNAASQSDGDFGALNQKPKSPKEARVASDTPKGVTNPEIPKLDRPLIPAGMA